MKYYSTELKRIYDTEQDLLVAEETFRKEQEEKNAAKEKFENERKARAQEVNDAFTNYREAEKKYLELRNKFVNDYGSYHMSYTEKGVPVPDFIRDLLTNFRF